MGLVFDANTLSEVRERKGSRAHVHTALPGSFRVLSVVALNLRELFPWFRVNAHREVKPFATDAPCQSGSQTTYCAA